MSFNKIVKLISKSKRVVVTSVNQFNYQKRQMAIDSEQKTFKIGTFGFNENVTSDKNIDILSTYLEGLGYKQIF